jgi:hypothetical protein
VFEEVHVRLFKVRRRNTQRLRTLVYTRVG